MAHIVKVAVVSITPEIRNMLQRFVGGILKDIGIVRAFSLDNMNQFEYDLYVVYTHGTVYAKLSRLVEIERIIPVELHPLPIGVKKVLAIPQGTRLGILSGHLWCAADFLRQLIEIGVRNYYFSTGTPDITDHMDVDYFIVPEETVPYIRKQIVEKSVIVPRSLSPKSISSIISATINLTRQNG